MRASSLCFVCHVRFVPTLEALEALHDGVVRLDDLRAERARLVALELRAGERDQRRGIVEAIRGAVQRDVPAAAGDVVDDRLLARLVDGTDVGVNHQRVVASEVVGREVVERFGVVDVDRRGAAGTGSTRAHARRACGVRGHRARARAAALNRLRGPNPTRSQRRAAGRRRNNGRSSDDAWRDSGGSIRLNHTGATGGVDGLSRTMNYEYLPAILGARCVVSLLFMHWSGFGRAR